MKTARNFAGVTDCLCETDSYIKEFDARVLSCRKAAAQDLSEKGAQWLEENGRSETGVYEVILDRTAFFAEGGGQQADEGTINGIKVIDVVISEDGNVCHYLAEPLKEGELVNGAIDFDIRFARMQSHGAEHILSGLIHSEYGYDNVGFHMSDSTVRFDINGTFTDEEVEALERKANMAVYRDLPVTISFPTPKEAASIQYRSKLDISEGVRLVTIEGIDVCACCAPHVSSTGQIGVIKIIGHEPHRQGTRFTMTAGINAYEDYAMLHKENSAAMEILSAKREDVAAKLEDYDKRTCRLREENTSMKYELSKLLTESIRNRLKEKASGNEECEVIFTQILDNVGLRNLINSCMEVYQGPIAGFIGNDKDGYRYIIGSSGRISAKDIAGKLAESFGAKGGGNDKMVCGSVNAEEKIIRRVL